MGALTPIAPRRRNNAALVALVLSPFLVWLYFRSSSTSAQWMESSISDLDLNDPATVDVELTRFANFPLQGPNYADQFGELGQRVETFTNLISKLEDSPNPSLERAALAQFPFLSNPSKPDDPSPHFSLRRSLIPGSKGIVIPVGLQDFRYACHLIVSLRTVLLSALPIQIVHAGAADLPLSNRQILQSLDPTIQFLDILTLFNDTSMGLANNWAIKPFAALASTFEQLILLDADAVFLQPPEVLFSQPAYLSTGTLFFHDRLLWQHAFPARHTWWKTQLSTAHRSPSTTLARSLVWSQDYAEEADSGVVVLDKRRVPIFMALLHVSWQNTKLVRENATYVLTYGDKESWWFGLELCGVPYSFSAHYGSIVGSLVSSSSSSFASTENSEKQENAEAEVNDVCGFTIAHVDEKDDLLWFNGSLLKNKAVDQTVFTDATHFMMDATWVKGRTKKDSSCMVGGTPVALSEAQKNVLERSVSAARAVDGEMGLL